jgi:hypothetical protein
MTQLAGNDSPVDPGTVNRMDATRLDRWTCRFAASASSRRFAIRTLTAAGLSALVRANLGQFGVAAKRRKRKNRKKNRNRCPNGAKRCGGACVRGVCCPDTACGPACVCRRGVGGATVCTQTEVVIACIQCASDGDCPSDRRCVQGIVCADATAVCVPECQS